MYIETECRQTVTATFFSLCIVAFFFPPHITLHFLCYIFLMTKTTGEKKKQKNANFFYLIFSTFFAFCFVWTTEILMVMQHFNYLTTKPNE